MTARYAIYYAPPRGCELWRRASAWLGRDAYDGGARARPRLLGLEALDLDALTADPRGYGFHATLKAPFELREGGTEADLIDALRAFAAARSPFRAPIAPDRIGPFHAFRLSEPSAEMEALHAACVRAFDPFRAPLSEFDLSRRRKARLTELQDTRLVEWGYPYIFEDFRFHMTLTGAVTDDAVSGSLGAALSEYFRDQTGPHLFDGVALFTQPAREAPFVILERADFG